MSEKKRIAIVTELEWAEKRHYELISGIQEYAEQSCPNWILEVSQYPELLIAKGVVYDGMIGRITRGCYGAAGETPIINTWIGSPVASKVQTVCIDAVEGGRMAAEHLVARGVRRFAHVGIRGRRGVRMHYQGVKEVTRRLGYPCLSHRVISGFEANAEACEKFWNSLQRAMGKWQAPMGLIASDDFLGRSIISYCKQQSWIVPEDLAVVSIHNNELICNVFSPTISSVDLGYHRNGYEAAKTLHQIFLGNAPKERMIPIPPKALVVRESSDFHAVRDPKVADALRFLAENSDQILAVPYIAAAVGLNRQTLERRFKEQTGRTILNELIRLRIEKLKRLLVETDMPVKDMPKAVGFGTSVNMHSTFKKYTGMTPSAYRKDRSDNRRW